MSLLVATVHGNLGKPPELKYSDSGKPWCRFSVAHNHKVRDRDGNWNKATQWVDVTVFGKQAELCDKFLAKGSMVAVTGELTTESWQGNDGDKRFSLKLRATSVSFGKRSDEGGGRSGGGYDSPPGGNGGTHNDADIPF